MAGGAQVLAEAIVKNVKGGRGVSLTSDAIVITIDGPNNGGGPISGVACPLNETAKNVKTIKAELNVA